MIKIQYLDDVNLKVTADGGLAYELEDYFKFRPKGYQFSPKYRSRIWNGWIAIYSAHKRLLPVGLYETLIEFCKRNDYEFEVDQLVENLFNNKDEHIDEFINNLKIFDKGKEIKLWDHQLNSVLQGINSKRMTLEAPTSCLSGNTEIDAIVS